MEARRLEITPLGRQDLGKIWHYIAQDNPEAADVFCQRLLDAAESLRKNPFLGSSLSRRQEKRKLVFESYLIIYEVREAEEVIKILRFWHGAQNPHRLRLREEAARYGQVTAALAGSAAAT